MHDNKTFPKFKLYLHKTGIMKRSGCFTWQKLLDIFTFFRLRRVPRVLMVLEFKSHVGKILHSVANSLLPLQHLETSCFNNMLRR